MTRLYEILPTAMKFVLTSKRNNSLSSSEFFLLVFFQLLDDDILNHIALTNFTVCF